MCKKPGLAAGSSKALLFQKKLRHFLFLSISTQ
jgi:hypothetical protein